MTDPRETLARIRVQAATASRTTVPHLVDALEKVLILHKPVEVEPSETICSGCSTLRGQGETARYFPFTEYPCPTVRDITTALEGETP